MAARQLDRRLREVSDDVAAIGTTGDDTILKRARDGPLPGVDKLIREDRRRRVARDA